MRKLVETMKRWIELFGVPAVIIGLLIAGIVVIAHEFFAPEPLDAAIRQDLQKSEDVGSDAPAPAEQSSKPD